MTHILVVEDERIVGAALQLQLEHAGYQVVANVGTAEQAVAAAENSTPDLVFMDINLGGGGDGIEAASRIRDQFRIPIVFLTAYSDPETLERAAATAPFGYLVKPVDDRALRPAVEMAMSRHRLETEREELLARVETQQAEILELRTFLPVCAWCRKVRVDEGYWQDLEAYLTDAFGVKVTHAICKDCAIKVSAEELDSD